MKKRSILFNLLIIVMFSQTACNSEPDLVYEDYFIQGIYEGCVTTSGNTSSETQRRCECATDVLVDNLSDEDWESVEQHFKAGKAFGNHARLRELIPQIQQCS